MKRRNNLQLLAEENIRMLLEKKGCIVHPAEADGNSHTLEVWSPGGFERTTASIQTGSLGDDTILLLYAKMINGRRVPVIVGYHLIKIAGEQGAWSLDDAVFQQILLDKKYKQLVTGDDGSLYAECDRQLLLDSSLFIKP